MERDRALSDAIDTVYDVFSRYLRPQRLEASPAKDTTRIWAMLTAAPLRQLSGEKIGPYSGSAIYTIGSVADYKHFLPRILEEAAVGGAWLGTEPEVIAARLNYAAWRGWPKPEVAALLDVFYAGWRCAMRQHPDTGADAESWFCALAKLDEPVEAVLPEWIIEARGAKLVQLADFVRKLNVISALDYRSQIYWHDVRAQVRASLIGFLTSLQVRSALAAADGLTNEDDLWRVQLAEQAISDFVSARPH
jgi:hypothetical protein